MEQEILRKIIANSIGSMSMAKELAMLNSSVLPDGMTFEGRVLDSIIQFRDEGITPDLQAIQAFLVTTYPNEDYTQPLKDLLKCKTDDHSIAPYVYSIRVALAKKEHRKAIEKISNIYEGSGSLLDKYAEALPYIRALSPRINKGTTKGFLQANADWWEQYAENIKASRAGKALGPQLPWKNSHASVPYMRPNEIMTIAGIRGSGKSTLLHKIGIDLAHRQGYDVFFCHLETGRDVYMSRLYASALKCPVAEIEQGWYIDSAGHKQLFDLREDRFKEKIDKIQAEFQEGEKTGRFIFHHCPGIAMEDLALDIQYQIEVSAAQGRKVVVLIDYFNKLGWRHYSPGIQKPQGLNIAANIIKDTAESLGCNIIVAAQDTLDKDYAESDTIRDANDLTAVSQVLIKIIRTKAEKDLPMLVKKGTHSGLQKQDLLKRDIYWQRVGEWSSLTTLKTMKSNNGSLADHLQCRLRLAHQFFYVDEYVEKGDYDE